MCYIRDNLLGLEDDFLSAMDEGGLALEVFNEQWDALRDDIDSAIASSALDEDTLALVALVSSRLEVLALSFVDMANFTVSVEASLKNELEGMFSQLSIQDILPEGDDPSRSQYVEDTSPVVLPGYPMSNVSGWPLDASKHPSSLELPSRDSSPPSLVYDSEDSEDEGEDKETPSTPLLSKRCFEQCDADSEDVGRESKRCRLPTSPVPESHRGHQDDSPCAKEDRLCRQIKPLPLRPTAFLPTSVVRSSVKLRKRRLSAIDDERPSKRPRELCVEPKGQTVSNPLPLGHNDPEDLSINIDDWASMFTMADFATYAPPDPSIPLEFDYTGLDRRATSEVVSPSSASTAADPPFDDLSEEAPPSSADDTVHRIINSDDVLVIVDEDISVGPTVGSYPLDDVGSSICAAQLSACPFKEELELTQSTPIESPNSASAPLLSLDSDCTTQDDSHLLDVLPLYVEAGESATEVEVHRSRSPSPLETPPPSFQDAISDFYPVSSPPRYTRFDQHPHAVYLPPPYHYSPQEKSLFTHGISLAADTLLHVSGAKHAVPEAFFQHAQVLRAGHAIAV